MPDSLLRAVVFDLDGLLFNTEELYQFVGSELMRRRGKTYDEALIHRVMGRPQPVALQMMIDWHGLDATVEVLASETEQVFAEILGERLEFMPGASELIASLEATQHSQSDCHQQRPQVYAPCARSAAIARTILIHLNVRRRAVRQTRSGGLSARRSQIWNCARRDDGVGRQPERMPSGRCGGGICGCRAWAA